MPYFSDLHTYLYRSSQLIQAYPSTRITTKYSLPKKSKSQSTSKSKSSDISASESAQPTATSQQQQPKRDPSATLTLKTFHPESGICLKYRTDKAAEVGRLLAGLGRLAKGELIDLPTAAPAINANDGDKMDLDPVVETEAKVVTATPAAAQTAGGGGKGKKKKGKK
ncbi:hypothetical protein PV10_05173 [Exophiala mesophila]|uniref:SRP9 domain-containing protein n=1 Tax=Exophiala mesophila TaxID=212818 RepID=A0A0D1ZJD6_EXOME|nr:uncharacterized protein PV10_05173 [Exophiala mesophila]KIV94009.1 hypothetical protein PV10_05173 [Exophiala mesophila]